MVEMIDRESLDSLIIAIVKESSKDVSARDVFNILHEKGIDCPYHRVVKRMSSLVAYHYLDSTKRMRLEGGYQHVFRLASA